MGDSIRTRADSGHMFVKRDIQRDEFTGIAVAVAAHQSTTVACSRARTLTEMEPAAANGLAFRFRLADDRYLPVGSEAEKSRLAGKTYEVDV